MSDAESTKPFYDPAKINGGRPMSPAQLAERWDCSHSSVLALCIQRKLRHFRIGKLYRIPADAVIEYEIGHYGSSELPRETIDANRGAHDKQIAAAQEAKRAADEEAKIRQEATNRISRQIRWKYGKRP